MFDTIKRWVGLGTPGPADGFWYREAGRGTAAGIDVSPDIAMTYSAVWACTRILAASGSCLPLNLYRTTGDRKEIATDHPVQRIIHNLWNPELTSMQMRMNGIGQQVNLGNFYGEIERDGLDRPVAVWPLHASRVKPARTQDGLVFLVRNKIGPPTLIPDADMFHVSSMITDDGRIGKGVIENARDSIGMGLATERQGAAYHKRGRPAYAITGGKFKTMEDREFFRSTWEDVHAETGRPVLLPDGATASVLGFSPEDQQFLSTRQHNVEEIARWYSVPPHMIQHLLRATFNNIEHMGIEFVVYSLIPWLKLWEEAIWMKLLNLVEQQTMFAKHNVAGLLRGDSKSRSEFYDAMWQLGVFSANEIRVLEDLNPIGPDGDKRFVPMNFTTLEKAGEDEKLPPPPPAPMLPPVPEDEDEEDEDELSVIKSILLAQGEKSESAIDQLIGYVRDTTVPAESGPNDDDKLTPEEFRRIVAGYEAVPDTREADLAKRAKALRDAGLTMVEDSLRRLLTRETKALTSASGKPSREFFVWLDEFYVGHQNAMANELRLPLRSLAVAGGDYTDGCDAATAVAMRHIESSREQVLQTTELQPNEWCELPARIASLTAEWTVRIPDELKEIQNG